MTLEQWLRATLTSSGTQTADLVDDRVFPVMAPKNVREPFVVYSVDSLEEIKTTCGPADVAAYGVELECKAKHFDDALAIAKAAIADLRASGRAQLIEVDSVSDLTDPEPGLFVRLVSLSIWFAED